MEQHNHILIIGTVCNSSMGCAPSRNDGLLGSFGQRHVDDSGKHFLSYLAISNLTVAAASFKKKMLCNLDTPT